ncbi:hypothetical protein EVA_14270 [gut metagenome]|uniref:Uncharacterized protein n=1 Tax=gut metagenome TaxID=749906 RepID=J9FT06_9ZZZZ
MCGALEVEGRSSSHVCTVQSTSSSVSGRGISTAGVTRKRRSQKRASPRIYCMGSPPSSRSQIFQSR